MPIMVNDMAKFFAAQTEDKCHVTILGMKVLPAAFASSMVSLSVLFQAIIFLGTSAMADYGSLRKLMLMGTAFIGAVFTSLFIFLHKDSLWLLAGIFMFISNIFYGYSVVFYNAYLGPIVRSIPEYVESSQDEKSAKLDEITNKLSTRGYMIGYGGGVFMLLLSIPIVLFAPKIPKRDWYLCEIGQPAPTLFQDDDNSLAFRITMLLCGIWWIGLAIFPMFWIHTRPGPPLPAGKNYVTASLAMLLKTVRSIKQLRHSFVFLIVYFLFSDAVSTIAYAGILFAKNDMGAGSMELMLLLIEVPLLGLIGNYLFLWIKNRFGLESKTMIVINLCILLALPVYSFIGFIPSAPFGMKKIWELFIFGACYGLNIGSIQSFARTVFIALTPPGHESEFFGFYEITDKGSAWIGPFVVALLTEWTGQIRYSFIYLLISLLIPAIVLRWVDVKEGSAQARAFSEAEHAVPMVEFGRLDTEDDDDDGLNGGFTPRGKPQHVSPETVGPAPGHAADALLTSSEAEEEITLDS